MRFHFTIGLRSILWVNLFVFRKAKLEARKDSYPYEILPHPLDIPDAEQLVEDLRGSKPVSYCPINSNYANINISKGSMNCSEEHAKSFSILVLIKTRASERDQRAKLRAIFRNHTELMDSDAVIQYGFLIGQSDDNVLEEMFHNDFVIGDFVDSYRNLTHKSMMGIRWAMEYCPEFDFYISLDVDVRIVLANVIKFLWDPFNYPNIRKELKLGQVLDPKKHFYSGGIFLHGTTFPFRDIRSPYYLSFQDYPAMILPSYVSGRLVIMSRKTVSSFYYLSPYVQHITVDDVYFGLMANKLRINPFPTSGVPDVTLNFPYSRKILINALGIHGDRDRIKIKDE